jgi:hypothetical protein
MRVYWRRLRPGELDHELVWLGVSVMSAALAAAWFAMQLPWPRCNFRALFGIPCFTCGSTRSATALLHGDFSGAWSWNPLATIAMLAIAGFDLYALGVLVSRAPRLRISFGCAKWPLVATLFAAGAANWLYLLLHGRA